MSKSLSRAVDSSESRQTSWARSSRKGWIRERSSADSKAYRSSVQRHRSAKVLMSAMSAGPITMSRSSGYRYGIQRRMAARAKRGRPVVRCNAGSASADMAPSSSAHLLLDRLAHRSREDSVDLVRAFSDRVLRNKIRHLESL